ncbi:30S ribosomal protein S8 [Thermoleophilum album]|uniref:Small ribosomal subunit protein uS8 n=1 Tax=Thermoleophilum album TaxID=29539 RepID=A0A1H6FLW7_THEAL|nr:30S ribosomal protein S8 [Thermoleophilum album]SEH11887.1 small subunit ribosomal protein S8 [Thermoleophilum album]
MTLTDPIADFLTRLRNAINAGHSEVAMPSSKFKAEIARILKEQGYIDDYRVEPAAVGRRLVVKLRWSEDRKPAISGLERVSKPGRRQYVSVERIPKVRGGTGIAIVSTSRGVLSDHEARRLGVGGELVAKVW